MYSKTTLKNHYFSLRTKHLYHRQAEKRRGVIDVLNTAGNLTFFFVKAEVPQTVTLPLTGLGLIFFIVAHVVLYC